MSNLAIIGIRKNSKSIVDKNIKIFCGKPLVYWIIQSALKSDKLDRIIVSTDSEEYRDIVLDYGVEVPFLRPKALSQDYSLEKDYLLHGLEWLYENEGYTPKFVTRLQATSPLQLSEDIDRSIECLESNKDATSSMVVSEALQPPMKALKEKNGYLVPYFEESKKEIVNRQELPTAYYRSNIITSRVSSFLESGNQIGEKSLKVEIPIERSIDINSELDFYLAEKIAKKICNHV
jgi:CMP-N-acetylneuraminic acid synthetase|tara:strand:- start:558 stop:1259 length:702 start_codon:yes stop_codon:yes gene_type:complete